jgi:hypothetical protein
MALIAKELKIERETVPFRLPKELAVRIGLYAQFIESSRDYVVTQVLQYVIDRDREFARWLEEHGETNIEAGSAPRGRGRPRTKTQPVSIGAAAGEAAHVAAHR